MSFPFFQGNVNDLLNVAGAGQGSFVLGQLMHAQQQQQKADLQKTLLANLMAEAENRRKSEMHPLEMEGKRVDINSRRVGTDLTREQVLDKQRTGNIFEATGGVQGAAKRISVEDQKKKTELFDKLREAFEDTIMNMPYSQGMEEKLLKLGTELQLPEIFMNNILAASRSPEQWKALQDGLYNNSRKGREQATRIEADRQTRLAVEKERTDRAMRVAQVKVASAQRYANKQDFEKAAVEMMYAAEAAREAGDIATAQKYEEMANKFAEQNQAAIKLREDARRAGTIDTGRTAQGGGVQVHPPANPNLPYPQQQQPGGVPPMPPGAVRPR
jgi:hypothetical protein